MKKITTFYIHHKVAAFFTALWLIFMVYIAITGFQKDNSHIIAGLVATLVMFVPGAVIIALVCAIISSIARTFSGIIKANSTDSNDVEPIIPSYSKSDYAPESASEPEDTVDSYVSPEPQIPVYDTMEGHDFEYYCAELLKNNGFYNVSVTQGSGDQGIDVLAEKGGVKYGIQCKCYSSDIGNKAVQEAFSGCRYYNCHVPVVMTNRYFTRQAKDLAQKTNVLLWDRDILNKYIQVSQGGNL